MDRQPAQQGFTLVELIITMVILSVVALGTTRFIVRSIDGYRDTTRREQLASSGRIAIEKMVRELRNAHPSSVRIANGNNCIEFLPILATASYQDQAVDYAVAPPSVASAPLPVGFSAGSFDAFNLSVPAGTTFIIAGNSTATQLHGANNPGPLANYNGTVAVAGLPAGVSRIGLGASHRFLNHSPARRFYLAGGPVAFCVQGTNLRRYSGYGLNVLNPAVGGVLLGENIASTGNDFFSYSSATTARNALVSIEFAVSRSGESVELRHEVQIRNVP